MTESNSGFQGGKTLYIKPVYIKPDFGHNQSLNLFLSQLSPWS